MHHTQRNSIALFLVHIGSCIMLLTSGAHAIDGEPINNIRVFQPILRRSPAIGDTSAPADFFGWAAIFHQTEVVNPTDSMDEAARKTSIIVGAPRGTFPGGLQLDDPGAPRAEQSGLVYNCPIRPGPCSGVRGDTDRYLSEPLDYSVVDNNASLDATATMPGMQLRDYPPSYIEGRLFDQAPNAILYFRDGEVFIPAENKTGQLLGATLFSNGETFMACAPRWTDTSSSVFNLLPRGVCYTSGRNLMGFRRLQPCGQSGSTFNTQGDGYCLAGTSALVSNGAFVIGAPLNEEGKGSLYVAPDISNPSFTSGLADIPDAVTGMGDPETRDQYQGYSTIAAFLTRRRDSGPPPNIVAAVPRYDDDTYSGRITVYNPSNFSALLTVNARGTQMAEFFGHSMIAVDINGDSYDDLVIGAPMNSDFGALKVERGRVYIFMNTGGDLNSVPIILNGLNPRGRFGTSLVNLGDIDDDGKEDFAVGAPYYAENIADSNTGAVYIYYGNSDPTAFETQVPFEITASDVVNNITGLNELRTFGFSVSGGVDVDNNQFNDLLVGAYDSQTVVLFRSLPVVNVTVDISIDVPTPIALDSVFEVSVTAYYEGKGINRQINVPFTLSEDRPATADSRLKFDGDGTGTFTFSGPGMMNTQMITVTSLGNTTSLSDHMLRVTIPGGIDLPMTTTDGNQTLIDLSSYPRLRLLGNNTLAVSVTDPCRGDGCQFDVRLSPQQKDILVIANDAPVYSVDLMYNNAGSEDAVGLLLNFTGLSRYIRSVAIRRQDAIPSETPCSAITSGFASCVLRTRFAQGATEGVMVNFTIDQDSLTGNEANFSVNVAIASETGNVLDVDQDPNNNAAQVNFGIVARADIAVSMLSFGGVRFDYTARAPAQPVTVQGLGRSTITLQVDIQNRGPTTIREGNITIYLANRVMDTQFTLYPSRIEAVNNPNGAITCDSSFVNPDGLPQGASQVGEGRRRRSASQHSSSSLKRVTRQDTTVAHTCIGPTVDSGICTVIQCTLSNLRRAAVPFTISVFTRIDERYFSSQPNPGTIYSLTTSASVSILSSFYGDNIADNSGQVTVELAPMVVESGGTDRGSLLHYILWPCIGGVLLLILAAILLYFVGFFSRKKKPEDGEIEGDMDPDKIPMKSKPPPEESKEPSAPAGAGGADGPSETTKV